MIRDDSAPVLDDTSPWPGLAAFSEQFQRYFFGRTVELEDLFRRVRRETLTVLYAQSGLGKTSLLQAGLFPRLREEGFLPIPIRLDYAEAEPGVRADADPPGKQITHAIARALEARGLTEASDPLVAPGPWEYLHDVDLVIPDETGSPLVPVLVFDQFEELFTFGADRHDEGKFADRIAAVLGDLVENRLPRELERALEQHPALVDRYEFTRSNYRVLLSFREDFLSHMHGLRGDIPSIILNNVRLTRFDRRQALEVVAKPAAARQLVTRTVAEAIVQAVAGKETGTESTPPHRAGEVRTLESISKERQGQRLEVDPALLSIFCQLLNRLRLERNEPTISLDLVASHRDKVMRDFYLSCFKGLSPPPHPGVKAFVEDYLLTSKGYRDRLTLERAREILVADYGGKPEELGLLVERRLLQIEERGKTPQIELTHDVLAPIASAERIQRVRDMELRQSEERQRAELERAELENREAKAREAAASAALAVSKRRQRVTRLLLGGVAIFAVAAAWLGARAEREARKSGEMLAIFCSYGLTLLDEFSDSTAGNPRLTGAFNSLVEISDQSVRVLMQQESDAACPWRLTARVKSASAGLQLELGDTAYASRQAIAGLAAAQRLLSWSDYLSRSAARNSFTDLTSHLYFSLNDSLSLVSANQALPLLEELDPGENRSLFDRRARVNHYGALAWLRLREPDSADVWVKRGLAVAAVGRGRDDQNQDGLLYTISQLHIRQSESDTLRFSADGNSRWKDSAIAASRRAVDATRDRMALGHTRVSHMWHARMQNWHGLLAGRLSRQDEALAAFDSSLALWRNFREESEGDQGSARARAALAGMILVATNRSRLELARGNHATAWASARLVDSSALSLIRLDASPVNRHYRAQAAMLMGEIQDSAGNRVLSDSAYHVAMRIDSLSLDAARDDGDTDTELAAIRTVVEIANALVAAVGRRAVQDTINKPEEDRRQALRALELERVRYREAIVFARREGVRIADAEDFSDRQKEASDSSLGTALGNLSWTYLLLGQGEAAARAAEEGFRRSPKDTFIIPNYVNALVLSGREDDAATQFAKHAGQDVEVPTIKFQCAVDRDIEELRARGVASDQHVASVKRLVARHPVACPPR